jgi:basic membrane protein A
MKLPSEPSIRPDAHRRTGASALKSSIWILGLVMASFLPLACGNDGGTAAENQDPESELPLVGLALGDRGIGDLGFNDMQYNGLIEISRNFPVRINYGIPESWQGPAVQAVIQDLLDQGAELIFTGANTIADAIAEIARANPETTFIVLDYDQFIAENVVSVAFVQEEVAFLAGYLAASMTRTGRIGFIGGVDIPPVELFEAGFANGAAFADPEVTIVREYLSSEPDFSGFNAPGKAREIALSWYADDSIDIIFAAAGGSGLGAIDALKSSGDNYFIGVDANQDYLAEGKILTSAMKNLDQAMLSLMERYQSGLLETGGVVRLGLENRGVGLSDFPYTRNVIGQELIEEISEIEQRIIDGEINVLETP